MNEENKPTGEKAPEQNSQPMSNKDGMKTIMGVFAYLGPLVIVSYLTSKDIPSVKFHIKQGLVLLIIEICIWILGTTMYGPFWMLLNIVNLGTLILSIIGIVNVVQGKDTELPLVGQFSRYFTF